jgi:4-oxalocrotonate tautomerase
MPFANFKFPQGTLDAQQKQEIIHRTTDLFADYFGDGVRPFTMVLVEEVADGGWGRADEVLTMATMGITPPSAALPAAPPVQDAS